jgi:hypothetical protein
MPDPPPASLSQGALYPPPPVVQDVLDVYGDGGGERETPDVWAWRETQLAAEVLRGRHGVRVASTAVGLAATFELAHPALDGGVAVLEVNTAAHKPGTGPGVQVRLGPPGDGGACEALALNAREAGPLSPTDLLGGWTVREGLLEHAAFYPDALRTPGLLSRIVLGAANRVQWLGATARLPH